MCAYIVWQSAPWQRIPAAASLVYRVEAGLSGLFFWGASPKMNEKLRGNDGGVCVRGGLAKWLQLIAGTLCLHCILSHTDPTSDSLPVS